MLISHLELLICEILKWSDKNFRPLDRTDLLHPSLPASEWLWIYFGLRTMASDWPTESEQCAADFLWLCHPGDTTCFGTMAAMRRMERGPLADRFLRRRSLRSWSWTEGSTHQRLSGDEDVHGLSEDLLRKRVRCFWSTIKKLYRKAKKV